MSDSKKNIEYHIVYYKENLPKDFYGKLKKTIYAAGMDINYVNAYIRFFDESDNSVYIVSNHIVETITAIK